MCRILNTKPQSCKPHLALDKTKRGYKFSIIISIRS